MVHTLYSILSGPMMWLASAVFVIGTFYRLWCLYRGARRKEAFIFSHLSITYGLGSIVRWLTPFATTSMRQHPALTVVSFVFHVCLLAVPLFLSAHIVLWEDAWGLTWWT
ncbi:MAG: nitrate reductase, partial [Desulfatitalea sp.]|nr:nitrate reductase [Desulfatitalea sp.]NNK02386.1 nitrate reductase [Desulfatitalea sp.]